MQMKHLIMGTAGHVDHGKTTLIRALTGYDCDTHEEEKQRGITINLGFTNLQLPSGNSVGVVDVPGHADFINTMVSGACGIDFVLLVVAADEGIMPQTREHLQIMEMLDISRGIIVLNKADLMEDELLELAEEEIKDTVRGTFLENAGIIKVSSVTGKGINELLAEIDKTVEMTEQRQIKGNFRMYIDRIFTVDGFGVVVNGSVLDGTLKNGDNLFVLPSEREVRVRRIEHHGKQVESVQVGDRASLNLAGFKQKEFYRGMQLSAKKLEFSRLIDAKIRLFNSERELGLWSQVIFLLGTVKQMVRMHLLDRDRLKGGEEGLVQIYLPREIVPVLGDRFIIRVSSGDETLGGGVVIDPYPLHHRRRRQKQIEIVQKLSSGNLTEIIAAEVRKSIIPLTLDEIAVQINEPLNRLSDLVYRELPPDIFMFQSRENIILILKKQKTLYQNKILNNLKNFHKQNPLSEEGRSFQELVGIFGENLNDACRGFLNLLLQEMESSNKLRKAGKTWVMYDHKVEIAQDILTKISVIEQYLLDCGLKSVPLSSGINDIAGENEISEKELKQILQKLLKDEKIVYYQGCYLHKTNIDRARGQLISYLKQHEGGITLAEFRDLLKTNRKMATLLLEYFDSKQITIRRDNIRKFTPKYQKYISS